MKVGFCLKLSVCILFVSSVQAHAQQPVQTLHGHVRPAVSRGEAKRVGDLPPTQRLNLSIVLAPHNQAELTSLVGQLYDAGNPAYHKFLSVSQFTEQFSPSAEDYKTVADFARARGLTVGTAPANRMVVPVSGTVAQVESAFNVRMGVFQHPAEPRTFFSPDREPSLDLAVPVAHIAGLNNFSIPKPMVTRSTAAQGAVTPQVNGSGPGGAYLGSDMRAAYYGSTALTGIGETVGLVEFDGYTVSDVNLTFSNSGQSYTVPIDNVLLDGATGAACQLMPSDCSDAEQVLDIAQAIWMAPQLSQVRVYIGNNDSDILNAIATDNLAKQVSISWTWLPDDPYTDDIFFEEMAAQGQSVFAASGDYGEFDPLINNFYPAEDAWVTAVGGTDLVTTGAGGAWSSETAWNQSGGGISPDGVPLPSWQIGVANASNGGSNTLRNVPDVAMEANTDNYNCNLGDCAGGWGGTSFAAPRWAAFMALANEQALNAGIPPVGFVNPSLYAIGQSASYGSEFHDITSGNNDLEAGCCGQPFYTAVTGYDLVTGWGSPTGQNLINSLAPAAAPGFQLSVSTKSLYVSPGSSGTTTITVKDQGGFTGGVELSVSGLPSGVTASWGSNPTSATSVLTLTIGSSAVRGSYLLTITGSSGSVTATAEVALEVNAPGFSIAASPATLDLEPGQSISTTVTVTDYAGFNGSVNLAIASALPNGVTATWSPDPTTGSSLLTLTASSSTASNLREMLTIQGYSGNLTASNTVALNMGGPAFQLGISPEPVNIVRGSSTTSTVTVLPIGGFSGSVTLSAPEVPAGVTATFNPATTTGTSTLTMTASSSATLGTSPVEIAATAANGSANYTSFSQIVTASPTFNLSASSVTLNVTQGGTVTDTIAVNPLNGFTGKVTLGATNLCCGISASFGANPTTGSSVLTISAAANAVVGGQYPVIITGSSGSQASQILLEISVNPSSGFTLSPSAGSVTVVQGTSVADNISVTSQTGFSGSVTLAVASPLPSGVTASFGTNPTTGTSVLTLLAGSSAAPGSYTVVVAGTSNGKTATTNVQLNIKDPVGSSTVLSISPSGALTAGSAYTLTATVTPASGTVTPTGSVIFTIGSGTQTVALNASGVATYTGTAPASSGSLAISAAYQGSATFQGSTSNTLNETVAAIGTTTVLSISPSGTLTAGSAYTLTATVTPASGTVTPTGNVIFTIGSGTQTVALNASGVATYTGTAPASSGTLAISAAYQGSATFLGSTSNTLNETVAAIGTTTVLGISPSGTLTAGSAYTLTATVTPASGTVTPTGSVIFTIGSGTQTVALNASGVATYSGAAATAGSLTVSAAYQGSTEFSPSSSSPMNETVVTPTAIIPYIQDMQANGAVWQNTSSLTVNYGDTVNLGPWPLSGGSWKWAGPNGFSSTAREIDNIPLNSATNVFTATYTNSGGATSTLTFTLTIAPTPIGAYIQDMQLNAGTWQSGSSLTVNYGDAVNLGPQPQSGGSWKWTGPNGFSSTAREIDNITLSSATNVFTATYTNPAGVASTETFTIVIAPTPIVPYIQDLQLNGGAYQATSSITANFGDTVNLGPQPQIGGSWSWTGPGGFTSSSRQINNIPLNSYSNVYTATYTNPAGVISTQIFTITIAPTPIVPYIQDLNLNGGAYQQVSGITVNYGDTVNLGPWPQSGGSWSWSGPNGFSSTTRQLNGIPLSSATNVFTATYMNPAGVTSTQVFTILIAPTPIIPYIEVNGGAWQSASSVTVTSGSTVSIGPQPQNGGSWSWTGPNGFTSSARQVTNVPLSEGSNSYMATYTNPAGVKSSQTFTINVE